MTQSCCPTKQSRKDRRNTVGTAHGGDAADTLHLHTRARCYYQSVKDCTASGAKLATQTSLVLTSVMAVLTLRATLTRSASFTSHCLQQNLSRPGRLSNLPPTILKFSQIISAQNGARQAFIGGLTPVSASCGATSSPDFRALGTKTLARWTTRSVHNFSGIAGFAAKMVHSSGKKPRGPQCGPMRPSRSLRPGGDAVHLVPRSRQWSLAAALRKSDLASDINRTGPITLPPFRSPASIWCSFSTRRHSLFACTGQNRAFSVAQS